MSSIAVPRPRYGQQQRSVRKAATLNRLFVTLIVFLSVVLALELAFHLFVAPTLRIQNVELSVAKDFPLSQGELLQAAGLTGPLYYYSVSPSRIEARLGAYPQVKSVVVRRIFPNGLRISITERRPLVVSLVNTGSETVPVAFDSQGFAVQVGKPIAGLDLPIISGITIPSIRAGMRLPTELSGFLEDLQQIKNKAPLLLEQISEIRFERKGGTSFDTILYPTNFRVPVTVGQKIDVRELKYIIMVLDVVQKQGMSGRLQDLDFRTGQVVYKLKEGSQSASG